MKRRLKVVETIDSAKITVPSLDYQLDIWSHLNKDLLGALHRLTFRHRFGESLDLKFTSELDGAHLGYILRSPGGSLTTGEKRWTHPDRTTGRRKGEAKALIDAPPNAAGKVSVTCTVSSSHPWSIPTVGVGENRLR